MEVYESSKTSSESLLRTADFASLCSFIINFGAELGIHLTFPQLLQFLELHKSANIRNWETLHVKLLNKLKYRARPDRWEPVLARFLLNHTAAAERIPEVNDLLLTSHTSIVTKKEDGLGCSPYYSLDAVVRAKVLLYLLEAQFDRNQAFKDKVNLKSPADLRFKPLGYDIWGRSYWLLKDSDVNLLLYREDSETDSFELLCEDTDEMRHLQDRLKDAHQPKTPLANILTCLAADNINNKMVKEEPAVLGALDTGKTVASLSETGADISPDKNRQDEEIRCNGQPAVNHGGGERQEVKLSVTTTTKTSPSTPVNPEEREKTQTANITSCSRDALSEKLIGCVDGLDNVRQIVKPEEGIPATDSTVACDPGDQVQNLPDDAAVAHPSNCQKLEEPGLETPQVAAVQSSEKDEALIVGVSEHRSTKRAHRSEPGAAADEEGEGQSLVELRRSGRQRKPVMFLKMEPIQPKRSKLAPQRPTDGSTSQPYSTVTDVETPSKRSRKNKKAASAALTTEKSNHVDNGRKSNKKKRKRKKKRKKNRKSGDVWIDHSSSSLESDEEDDYFEQVLLERERNDSDASDNCSAARKTGHQNTVTWLDQPESDLNLSDISDNSDTDSLIQGRNLARQKRLQRKLKSIDDSTSLAVADQEPADEQQCEVCLKSHLPEWLLLCDQCDLGHHTMCLRPALMTIPEGDWYCPRCRHVALVSALEETAAAIDTEKKKQVLWRRMQERLNFVNISMTNILAEGAESKTTPSTGRRRVRNHPTTNLCEESEESSRDDQTTGSGSTTSRSDRSGSEEEYSEEGGRKRFTASRRRRAPNGRRSSRTGSKRSRYFQPDVSNDEEEDDNQSSSAGASPEPGPRATRQRRAQYDLKEAFKGLDEALEEDEKYREEKLQRQQRKSETSVQHGDADPTSSKGSPLPPGKSRGKDLSNILGPDWRDDDDDGGRPSRKNARSHRAAGRLSSSEESTDGDGCETDGGGFPGSRKRRHRDSDSDFRPASGSATASSGSSVETEASESTASGSMSSDQSWLCAASRRRKTARHGGSRSKRRKRRSSKVAASGGQRRRGRPVPRFEADESYAPERPRRCVRAVVSYRESDGNADSDVGEGNRLRAGRARHAAQLDSDGSAERETVGGEPFQGLGSRNRRILASDGEDGSSTGGGASSGVSEEARGESPDGDPEVKSGHQSTTADGEPGSGDQANRRPAGDATSSWVKREDTDDVDDEDDDDDDDDYSPSALVISETSPCEVKLKVVPPPLRPDDDDDEESVEEEADDLIPRHRLLSSSTVAVNANCTLGGVPHNSPSPPVAPPSAAVVFVSCPKSSPDLFS